MNGYRWASSSLRALAVTFALTSFSHADLFETWETAKSDPFNGAGNLTWTGDLAAWAHTDATWPMFPDGGQVFAGGGSLRSAHHRTVMANAVVVETVITNISSEADFSRPMEWSVFISGNSIVMQPNRRADFILLADTPDVGAIEHPNFALNGYKLTLDDPYANPINAHPPHSHQASNLADALILWRVNENDDRWRIVGSIPLGSTDNINAGWNLRVRRDVDGTWSIGFANGAPGQTPALTSLGIDAGGPALVSFAGSAYAGVGWAAPPPDNWEFGFDNFRVFAVPEPSTALLAILGLLAAAGGCMRATRLQRKKG
jgi:hypothetical protein